MEEIDKEMEDKLNAIGIALSELQQILRIIQACFNDEENLKADDSRIMFDILKSKITELKKDFHNIQAELKI